MKAALKSLHPPVQAVLACGVGRAIAGDGDVGPFCRGPLPRECCDRKENKFLEVPYNNRPEGLARPFVWLVVSGKTRPGTTTDSQSLPLCKGRAVLGAA